MEEILRIAQILTSPRLKRSQNILDKPAQDTKLKKFYDAVVKGKYRTEEEAARHIYKTTPSSVTYKMLKWRLKGALEDVFFQYEATDHSNAPYQTKFQYCQRKLSVISLLLMFGVRGYSISMAEKLLKIARDHDLSEIELQCLKILRSNHWYVGNQQRYNQATRELNECLEKIRAELRAEELYDCFSMQYINRKAPPQSSRHKLKKIVDEITALRKVHNTYSIHLSYYRLMALIYYNNREHQQTVRVCEEIEEFFVQKPKISSKMRLGELSMKKAEAYFLLRDYKNALTAITHALELIPTGTLNWFSAQSIHFLIAMHTRNIVKAASIYTEITKNERFNTVPERVREEWVIYGAYVNLAARLWDIPLPKISVNKRETRVSTLMNDVSLFEKDKYGAYVALHIYQVVRYLLDNDAAKLMKIAKSISNYTYRYSDVPDESTRSMTMLRLIRYVFISDIDHTRLRNNKIVLRYLSGLEPRKRTLSIAPMEIIPYEVLWQVLLDTMEKRAWQEQKESDKS